MFIPLQSALIRLPWVRIRIHIEVKDVTAVKIFSLSASCFSVFGDLPLEPWGVKAPRCRASHHGSEQRSLQPWNHCAPALQPSSSGAFASDFSHSDPGSNKNKKEKGGGDVCLACFCSHKFHRLEFYLRLRIREPEKHLYGSRVQKITGSRIRNTV